MNECKRTPSIVFKSSADVIPSGDDITPSGRAEERADLVGTKLGRVLSQASDIERSDVGSIAGEADATKLIFHRSLKRVADCVEEPLGGGGRGKEGNHRLERIDIVNPVQPALHRVDRN